MKILSPLSIEHALSRAHRQPRRGAEEVHRSGGVQHRRPVAAGGLEDGAGGDVPTIPATEPAVFAMPCNAPAYLGPISSEVDQESSLSERRAQPMATVSVITAREAVMSAPKAAKMIRHTAGPMKPTL